MARQRNPEKAFREGNVVQTFTISTFQVHFVPPGGKVVQTCTVSVIGTETNARRRIRDLGEIRGTVISMELISQETGTYYMTNEEFVQKAIKKGKL